MKDIPIYIHCSICGARSPKPMMFAGRMKWLREHREKNHPAAFKASIRKGIKTKKSK